MSNDIDSRKLLDVALGHKPSDIINLRKTDTFLDQLPKDVIQYLHQYTGPIDCFYMTSITLDRHHRRVPTFYAWVNKSQHQATQEARNKGFYNNQITAAKIIFMDGEPYLAQRVEKRKLFGMPKPRKKERARATNKSDTTRCTGKTNSGKRCKHRTSNTNGKCTTHFNQ